MKSDLRYTASDCFDTFPFPKPDPREVIPELEDIGERLYEARAKYMVDENVGLTITYNRLKDPDWDDPRIDELRELHEEMDRAVLDAYGWSDVPVPSFCLKTPEDHAALEAFQDEVIDRLFVLNAERAAEEERLGLRGKKGTGAKKSRRKKKATAQEELGIDVPQVTKEASRPSARSITLGELRALTDGALRVPASFDEKDAVGLAMLEVLQRVEGPIDTLSFQIATSLVCEPEVLWRYLDDDWKEQWERLTGMERPPSAEVPMWNEDQQPRPNSNWWKASKGLRDLGLLSIDEDGFWSLAKAPPQASSQPWLEGRLAVAAVVLASKEVAGLKKMIAEALVEGEHDRAIRAVS